MRDTETESKKCNALEHVPTCSTWPPRWLTSSTATGPPATPTLGAAAPKQPDMRDDEPAECKAKVLPALSDIAETDDMARVIEADLGLPAGSLMLFTPARRCPGCTYCRPASSATRDAEGDNV